MFSRTIRKKFHVSTSRVYMAGRKSLFTKTMHFFLPYAQKGGYRLNKTSALMAL